MLTEILYISGLLNKLPNLLFNTQSSLKITPRKLLPNACKHLNRARVEILATRTTFSLQRVKDACAEGREAPRKAFRRLGSIRNNDLASSRLRVRIRFTLPVQERIVEEL